jgi:DNA-binding FadR family transcriptional regulator
MTDQIDQSAFTPLARRTYVDDVIRTIQDMILDGRLAPGQRLPPERALSEALKVSRPTVREASRSLQAMNILESRHGSGTYVSSLGLKELLAPLQFVLSLAQGGLEHLFEVRLLLEPGAAGAAAERATAEDIADLLDCVARTETEVGSDPRSLLRLDIELHELILRAAKNPLLEHLMAAISAMGAESRSFTARLPGVSEKTVGDHAAIVAAIAAREPGEARVAMTAHLTRIRDSALASSGSQLSRYASR